MPALDFVQVGLYIGILLALTPLLGFWMAKVFSGEKTFLTPVLSPIERTIYRVCWVNPNEEMAWKSYAWSVTWFSVLGLLATFFLQIKQSTLPLNPQHFSDVPWALALNTAVSFVTNTNWQAYSGESTLSYATQMCGLTVQNFMSAAVGMAVLIAFIRGLTRKNTCEIGNFWVDLTRATLYVLLPLSLVVAVLLISQGVIQNLLPYVTATTMEGAKQIIPMGPAASQIAIKQLGTNGGGFFGLNSAHPFENPTPFSNFIQVLSILLIPSALVYTFGLMTGARRHAWMIYVVMMSIFLCVLGTGLWSEHLPNPTLGIEKQLEGKELRFGITQSVLWSTATSAASNGSVNAMHDSLTPLTGGLALFLILLGEVVFGGVGSGLYGMLLFVLLTVFLAGLMVGRTPEYMGKKIEAQEIQWVLLAILSPSVVVLLGSGLSIVLPLALASLGNHGPHGLTEILHAFGSAANNNGSALGGLNVNTDYYNLILSVAMWIGRFSVMISVLAIAGNLAAKKVAPVSSGTFSTDTPTFAFLLLGIVLIIGALTFLPSLTLGPVVEHFLMQSGRAF